jgi:hypothetical protein
MFKETLTPISKGKETDNQSLEIYQSPNKPLNFALD